MASKRVPLPPRLADRGVSPAVWKTLTDAQRRSVIRESDQVAAKAAAKAKRRGRAYQPKATRDKNRAARAKRFAQVPEEKRTKYWRKYGKGDEDAQFWAMYKAIV